MVELLAASRTISGCKCRFAQVKNCHRFPLDRLSRSSVARSDTFCQQQGKEHRPLLLSGDGRGLRDDVRWFGLHKGRREETPP